MKRQEIVKVCDRCPQGRKPVYATRTIRFGFGETFWDIDVCEKHGDALERELYAWGLLGREVEEQAPQRFSSSYVAEQRRVAELRSQQSTEDRARAAILEAAQLPVANGRELLAQAGRREQMAAPADAGEYVFTEHAIERMTERDVKAIDALWAASAPTLKRPAKEKGLMVHERGTTKVVVNPATKTIITVAKPDRETRKAVAL